jgi:hypothetical protein
MMAPSQQTLSWTAVPERTLADLALDIQASRRALARLLRHQRALRARLRQMEACPVRAAPAASQPPIGGQEQYWVERGVHTRRRTFTAVLTPVPAAPGGSTSRSSANPAAAAPGARIKVETALDCWWSWRHPNMTATIVGRRGKVLWLDFRYPETGGVGEPFPAYRDRYDQARREFLSLSDAGTP